MKNRIEIDGKEIGVGMDTYIIAEISANHRGRIEDAKALIDAAQQSGADAVKLQTYTADTITLNSNAEWFRIDSGTQWDGRTLYDLYTEASMPWEWQPELQAYARERGITLFSTPFDLSAVEFLESLEMPAYKIASFELVDIPLIERVAQTGKPIIISTGMGSQTEIAEAVRAVQSAGGEELVLLKCTSCYPCAVEEMNLGAIADMHEEFGVPVGLSDHSLGIVAPVTAVGVGACVIEKHITLSRDSGGPDSAFSLEPDEFEKMVKSVRESKTSQGKVIGPSSEKETAMRKLRKSLFVSEDMHKGDVFSSTNVRSVRPAAGLHTRYYKEILGRGCSCDIEAATPLQWSMVEGGES